MVETFLSGGVMMWPLLAVAIGVATLSMRAALRLARAAPPGGAADRSSERARAAAEARPPDVGTWLQAILFWGGMAVLLGILGTVVGLVVMAQAIGLAGSVEPRLVWGGVGVSLVTSLFGLLIFLFASLSWFTLRQWSLR